MHDLRDAIRALRRSPGFAAVAVLTLAVGIGATTAIYSVADAILIRPLPLPGSDRLVRLAEQWATKDGVFQRGIPHQQFLDCRARTRTMEAVAGFAPTQAL